MTRPRKNSASQLSKVKDLRQAVERARQELAAILDIFAIGRPHAVPLSRVRRYVEAMGGRLEMTVEFPNRTRIALDLLTATRKKSHPERPNSKPVAGRRRAGGDTLLRETPTMSVKRVEWEHIQRELRNHGYNVAATARALSMQRRTLQRKLQRGVPKA